MSKLKIPSKFRLEDFRDEDQPVATLLANTYNPFVDDLYRALNGNLNTDNMLRQIATVQVKMDGSGKVINSPKIRLTINSKVVGTNVISAVNDDKSTTYPTSQPFISYSINDKILTIDNISGLQANSTYNLTIEIIGN